MTVPGRTPSLPQAGLNGQQKRQLSYGYDLLHSRGYVHHSRCHNRFHTSSAHQHQHQHQHRHLHDRLQSPTRKPAPPQQPSEAPRTHLCRRQQEDAGDGASADNILSIVSDVVPGGTVGPASSWTRRPSFSNTTRTLTSSETDSGSTALDTSQTPPPFTTSLNAKPIKAQDTTTETSSFLAESLLSSLGGYDTVSSLLPSASSSPSQNQSFYPPEISAAIADPVVSATPVLDIATIQDDSSFSDSIPVEDAANSSSVPLQTTAVGLIEEIISVALTLSSPPALTPLLDDVDGVMQSSSKIESAPLLTDSTETATEEARLFNIQDSELSPTSLVSSATTSTTFPSSSPSTSFTTMITSSSSTLSATSIGGGSSGGSKDSGSGSGSSGTHGNSSPGSAGASTGDEDGPSTGAVIGSVIGAIAGVALLVLAIVLLFKRRKRNRGVPLHGGSGSGIRQSSSRGIFGEPSGDGPAPPVAEGSSLPSFAPSAVAALPGGRRTSSGASSGSQKGFERVSGRKLPSVITHGGDGFTDPRENSLSERFFSGDPQDLLWKARTRGTLAVGTPMRPESGVMFVRNGPARTPVTAENPFADPISNPFADPVLACSSAQAEILTPPRPIHDPVGRSLSSQDGSRASRGSGSRFTEDI